MKKVQKLCVFWDQDFDVLKQAIKIKFVTGDEWKAGNLILSFKIKT